MIATRLTLARVARLLGLPRWRLRIMSWTGRFIPWTTPTPPPATSGSAPGYCAGAPKPDDQPRPALVTEKSGLNEEDRKL